MRAACVWNSIPGVVSGPAQPKAAERGLPSYSWRFGQERRFSLLQRYTLLENRPLLDVGCGVGVYLRRLRDFSPHVFGVDVELDRLREAAGVGSQVALARAEALPFADHSFAMLLLHEVLEHVDDDGKALREAYRVLQPGGRLAIFSPNRWYPFETHGIYWRGHYRFGNYPLVGYLPAGWRQRLAPHVRAYTGQRLRALFMGLEGRIIVHTQIFPGYDRIAARRPLLGRILRRLSYWLEATPLRAFALSHFLVFEKAAKRARPESYD